ncbi:rna-directed dna polymerase from mobile element jockey-like [Limosa lapponica baueri]|uniref:Rna-directed dna polymerase from mobile element jockey-like n=1 Tax=Limosa lapponica baueri TaxID=1758121 RepID=A0A2I0UGW9_LIMLA|nr:rna-directed dna polymerase from mobile element jockey-like [Limosa lapponica baueri]
MEKAEVLNAFFTSVFTSETHTFHESQGDNLEGGKFTLVEDDQVREYLSKLDIPKFMDPDGMYPQVLRDLVSVIAKLILVIFECSCLWREMLEDRRNENVTLVFMKGKKEYPGNNRLISLTSIPVKVVEQFVLETISRHMKDRKVIRSSQHEFIKGTSCLTSLITFNDEVPGLAFCLCFCRLVPFPFLV